MNSEHTILVVDDSDDNREAVAEMLQASGYVVDTAKSGNEAIQKFVAKAPDLFLLDVVMPEMGGLDLLREIRVNESAYEAIMMTGHESLQDAKKSMELGAFSYVAKPLRWEELKGHVERALNVVRIKKERLRQLAGLENEIHKRTDELNMTVQILQGQSTRLDAIINSMEEGLLAVDDRDRIVLMNAPAETILGVRFGQCAGELLNSAIRDPYISFQLASAIETSTGENVMTLPSQGGGSRHFHVKTRGITGDKGVFIGRVITFLDQTDKIKAEQMRTSFLSIVAHELRTPINVIMNYLTLISGMENSEIVTDMKTACLRVSGLVDELLSFVCLSGTTVSARSTGIDIQSFVRLAVGKNKKRAAEKMVAVKIDCVLHSPVIPTDPKLLGIALVGLLDNAIKFSNNGGLVRIIVDVLPKNEPSFLSISIIDQGIGISEQVKKSLFENFTQGEDHMTRHYRGLGIGLYLVKRAVELLGGKIDVASTEGEGSCFTFTVPLFNATTPAPEEKRDETLQIAEAS
jgi:two-component system phosphate regulon sensor histidine kinase PhoR